MFKSTKMYLFVVVLVLAVQSGYAADKQQMGNMNTQKELSSEGMKMHTGHGVVNKINVVAGKVNISHEPIESMNWPKMTMDFTVKNKADLEVIKPGMPVDFEITQQGKGYIITNIKPAK